MDDEGRRGGGRGAGGEGGGEGAWDRMGREEGGGAGGGGGGAGGEEGGGWIEAVIWAITYSSWGPFQAIGISVFRIREFRDAWLRRHYTVARWRLLGPLTSMNGILLFGLVYGGDLRGPRPRLTAN